jgi:hypothetical protein
VPKDEAPGGLDPRLLSSLEWAVSAAASIGTQAINNGRDVGLLADPGSTVDRLRFAETARFATHLAMVREISNPDLSALAGVLRTAARDSALIAVLGRLDPRALRLLADVHPRGRSSPALAMLLDVDTWATTPAAEVDPAAVPAPVRPSECEATAEVLRNAGWRVAVVRRGTTTAQAWQVLLAGIASSARIPLGSVR